MLRIVNSNSARDLEEFENYSDQCPGGTAQACEAIKTLCEQGRLSIGEARLILKALGHAPWVPKVKRAQPVKNSTRERAKSYCPVR